MPPRTVTPQFVKHRGHEIAYLSYPGGSGARGPLVFVHGLTGSIHFWEPAMYAYVRDNYTWYSVSLPYHFPSTGPRPRATELNEELFSELLGVVIDRIAPGEMITLVGYSLGAFACLNYAAKNPDRVRGVISISGFATGRARGLESILQFFSRGRRFRKWLFHRGWGVVSWHRWTLKLAVAAYACDIRALYRFPALDATLRAIYPDVRRHDPEAMRQLFRWLLAMNWLDEVHRIQLPVLVLAGECDPIIPYTHQKRYARQLPQVTFIALAQTGHVPFAEAPGRVESALVAWLEQFA